MTDKELKKLSRSELLELLIDQMKENERLRLKLKKAYKQLHDRKLVMEQTGSIAEAALQLNGVFEAAQAAADQYLESLEYLKEKQEALLADMDEEFAAEDESADAEDIPDQMNGKETDNE